MSGTDCKSTETESKICKQSFMQITGYNLNDFWSRDGRWIKRGTWNVAEHSGTCVIARF